MDYEDLDMYSFYGLQRRVDELLKSKEDLKCSDNYYDEKMKNINTRINLTQIAQEKLVTVDYK